MDEMKRFEFEKAFELRKFEIENFWKRGWFFGALLIALTAGYFSLKPETQSNYYIFLSFIAFFVSLAQCLMNRGSKYWQERWEYFTKEKEKELGIEITNTTPANAHAFHRDLAKKNENALTKGWRFSVSKLTFLVWDITTICWFLFWLNDTHFISAIHHPEKYSCRIDALIFHGVIVCYILFFVSKNKAGLGFSFNNGGGGKIYEIPF